jgi:hypothetical protein
MIKINNNEFNDGDEITFFYNDTIIQGQIHIPDDDEYYILHNERSYWYDDTPIKTKYKYAWFFRLEESSDNFIFHKIEVEKNFKHPDDSITRGFRIFLSNQINLYPLFYLKLGEIDKYEIISESDKQGFVELHSKKRNKKLSIKLGRLIGKLINAFNQKITTNPKNQPFKFLDKDIQKLHNQWMAAHTSEVKYDILTGQDIIKGYSNSFYCKGKGTLHNSCMSDKKDLLKLYTHNPENISLLVFYDVEDKDKIAGRTLIWKCDDGNLYHDRIYYTQDWFEHVYSNICKELGYKKSHNIKHKLKVTLKKLDFRKYPYLDTFHYISFKQKALFNNTPENIKIKYSLKNTNGYIQEIANIKIDEEDNN